MAYLVGKALYSRRAGMLWAGLLLVPSWSTFESLFPQHTQWTATFTLATIVAALRFKRTARPRYFLGPVLARSLAVHAHPSAAGLALIGCAMLVLGLRRGVLRPWTLAVAFATAVLPFVPMLVDQISRGLPVVGAAASYLGGEQAWFDPSVIPSLVAQSLLSGLTYWFGDVFGTSWWIVTCRPVVFGGAFSIGAMGYAAWLGDTKSRPLAFFPLFDVVGKRHDPPRPLLMLPAYAMSRSAALLCRGPMQLHGPYAWRLLHGYALEGRLACGEVDVRLGGPLPGDWQAWIDLPRAVLRSAGIDADAIALVRPAAGGWRAAGGQ